VLRNLLNDYKVAQKMYHWTKCNFSITDRDFSMKFQDLQRKEFSTIPENFSEIFSASRLV